MTKRARGFTMIEVLVVVAIIGILATITFMGFGRYQADARDSARVGKATVISEALEKYYDKNGEYPSCLSIAAPAQAATVTTSVLPGLDAKTLVAPQAASGTTNSLACTDLTDISQADFFAYVGDGSTTCSNGQACLSWTLKYKEESTGVIKTIISRRTTDDPTTLINVVATTNSSTQITASWNSAPEAVSYNLEYASNSSFTGSTFVNGLTGTNRAVTGLAPGQRYYFRIYTVTAILSSQASPSANAVTTLNAPSAPTVADATPASITTYSWPAVACPAGATARYRYRYVIDYTGGYTSAWYGPTASLSSTYGTSSEGYSYTAEVQAQCYNANTVSAWSTSGSASYYRPVNNPGAVSYGIYRASANLMGVTITSSCTGGAYLDSRSDAWSGTEPQTWLGTGSLGWYADSHGGVWTNNAWGYYGTPLSIEVNNVNGIASGTLWAIRAQFQCHNYTTGAVGSIINGQSGQMALP